MWKLSDNRTACTFCPNFEKETCTQDIQEKMLTVVISNGRTEGDFFQC